MVPSLRRWVRSFQPAARGAALAAIATLALAGCSTGDVAMLATVSGGEKVRVPITRNGAELTEANGIQIHLANYTIKEKQFVGIFEFADRQKRGLRQVRVEEVSDEKPVPLLDVANPTLSATGVWHGETEPMPFTDPRLQWITTLSNSLRVFRFTLTFTDGQTQIVHQGTLYPDGLKAAIRQTFGMKY